MVHTLEKSKANFREAETRMEPAPLNSPLAEVSKSSFHDVWNLPSLILMPIFINSTLGKAIRRLDRIKKN